MGPNVAEPLVSSPESTFQSSVRINVGPNMVVMVVMVSLVHVSILRED